MNVCRLKYFIFVHRPSLFPYYTYLAMTLLSMTCKPNQKKKEKPNKNHDEVIFSYLLILSAFSSFNCKHWLKML